MQPLEESRSREIRSEEVQEILGKMPAWIIRWGNSLVFMTIAALLALSFFVKYPDVIPARVLLSSDPPAIRLVAQASGRMEKLWVKAGDTVLAQQKLALLENAAHSPDVFQLEQNLDSFQQAFQQTTQKLPSIAWNRQAQVGVLQNSYANFLQTLDQIKLLSSNQNHYLSTRLQALQQQISELNQLNTSLNEQQTLLRQDVLLAETRYENQRQLLEKGVISRQDLALEEEKCLQKKLELERNQSRLFDQNIRIEEYQKQRLALEQGQVEDEQALSLRLMEQSRKLQAELEAWKQKYLLRAPSSGVVSLSAYWSEEQFVREGEIVMSLQASSSRIIGKLMLGQKGGGKVRLGQQVNIRLDQYDAQEFGLLLGEISRMSSVPENGSYQVDVELEYGMETSYHKQLEFRPEMEGQAEIITQNLRLIERFFYTLIPPLPHSRTNAPQSSQLP